MTNNNGHQNLSCEYAEQVAAYLYDEFDGKEKSGFEKHLQNCRLCTDELAGFSLLRSSIKEWRTTDFEPLSTPLFVMPAVRETVSEKPSWFETLKSYVAFSPSFVTASAAVAVLITIAGLIWFTGNKSTTNNLAENEKSQIQNVNSSIQNAGSNSDNETIATNVNPQISNVKPQNVLPPEDKGVNLAVNPQAVKASVKKQLLAKTYKISQPTFAKNIRPANRIKNDVPSLNVDDEEEDSLRLSDLFDEVGMNKPDEVKNE